METFGAGKLLLLLVEFLLFIGFRHYDVKDLFLTCPKYHLAPINNTWLIIYLKNVVTTQSFVANFVLCVGPVNF